MNLIKLAKNIWSALTAYKAINDLPDSIVFIDTRGFIKRANQKAIECFGFSSSYIKVEDFIKEGLEIVKKSALNSAPISATAVIPGREFYVELNARRIEKGYCVAIRDLTKLTEKIDTEEKIVKFNNEKNAMLVKLEGDIKSPISSITGFSKGLLSGLGGELSEKQEKYIKIIHSNSLELNDFVENLLDFSKAESSIYEPALKNFDIVEETKSIIRKFEPQIAQQTVSFDFDYSGIDKRTIYTDLNAFKTFIYNILAVSFEMTNQGYIAIKLKQADDKTAMRFGIQNPSYLEGYIHITIRNTGEGISEDEMKYLCDPYTQLEKGKKNFVRALKLGTASILIKRCLGSIYIKSDVKTGTIYDILVPTEKRMYE